jgi:hypothetical protein
MLSFTVRDGDLETVYRGICSFTGMPGPAGAVALAMVMNEGEVEWWWLDQVVSGVKTLRRFYRDQHPHVYDNNEQLTVYLTAYPRADS